MKKIITLLCVSMMFSMTSLTVSADNETSVAAQITDAREIYSILAPFVEKNYANEAEISYNEDEDSGIVGVLITFRQRAIGESESDVKKMADEIVDYMIENNIDPSFALIFVLDDEPDNELSVAANNKAGDINSDGKIDVTDLSELSLALADGKEFTEEQQNAADVDGDGRVTLSDLARMRQYLSKIIEAF